MVFYKQRSYIRYKKNKDELKLVGYCTLPPLKLTCDHGFNLHIAVFTNNYTFSLTHTHVKSTYVPSDRKIKCIFL